MRNVRRFWNVGRRRAAMACAGSLLGLLAPRAGAQCVFGGLQWTSDATRLQFDITCGLETRRASVDVATGAVRVEDARVREPVQCGSRGSIVFRDVLGIFECAAVGTEPARLVVPAPENGVWFVRAYGEDAGGRLIAWLYDRERARHVLVSVERGTGALRTEPQPSAPEALRAWTARQRGTEFTPAGGSFRRSVCARFRARPERVCVEPLSGVDDQSFRLTLGRPGAVAEWVTHVWPSGWSMAPDSAAVLVGLMESEHDVWRCGTWIVGPERAKRAGVSAGAREPAPGLESWVLWVDPVHAWWADAAGALWTIDREAMVAVARLAASDRRLAAVTPPPAPGATSPVLTGPRGAHAWVRAVATAGGVDCELWVDPGSGARRVVGPLVPEIAD